MEELELTLHLKVTSYIIFINNAIRNPHINGREHEISDAYYVYTAFK